MKATLILQEWLLFFFFNVDGFPNGSVVRNLPANAGDAEDMGLISGSGRSPGGGNGNPLQYSCQEKPMGRGAWHNTVHGVTKGRTRLDMHVVYVDGYN